MWVYLSRAWYDLCDVTQDPKFFQNLMNYETLTNSISNDKFTVIYLFTYMNDYLLYGKCR